MSRFYMSQAFQSRIEALEQAVSTAEQKKLASLTEDVAKLKAELGTWKIFGLTVSAGIALLWGYTNWRTIPRAVAESMSQTAVRQAEHEAKNSADDAKKFSDQAHVVVDGLKDQQRLANLLKAIGADKNGSFWINFANGKGRYQYDEGGKRSWFDQPDGGGRFTLLQNSVNP